MGLDEEISSEANGLVGKDVDDSMIRRVEKDSACFPFHVHKKSLLRNT